MDDLAIYLLVNAVMSGLMIKPLFIIWIVSLCMVRRAGSAFHWMKVAFPIEML